jgi:hypothetical protein
MIRLFVEILVVGLGMVTFMATFVLLMMVNLATRALTRTRRRQQQWTGFPQADQVDVEYNSYRHSGQRR